MTMDLDTHSPDLSAQRTESHELIRGQPASSPNPLQTRSRTGVNKAIAAETSARTPSAHNQPRHPRVALLVETSRSYGRELLFGIARYVRAHGPWDIEFT